jgi:hypothetical protein
MVTKTAAFKQRRAADTARWRERLQRGAAVYPVEVDGRTFDLMERLVGLPTSKLDDRGAVAAALAGWPRRELITPEIGLFGGVRALDRGSAADPEPTADRPD